MPALPPVIRRFTRAPGFTAIALVTLAIGIGANTAVFSVLNGVLIKPLTYPNANELVGIWHSAPGLPGLPKLNVSPTMYFTYRETGQTFRQLGVWQRGGVTVTGQGEPELVRSARVTFDTLPTLGVTAALGRWFSPEDDTPGGAGTVILMPGYWHRRFGSDASIVGRAVTIDAKSHTVIGVMPDGFQFLGGETDVLLPMQFDRNRIFLGNFSYQGVARLKPGVTLEQANADIARMLPAWWAAWPAPPGLDKKVFETARLGPLLTPLKQDVVGDITETLWILMGTIGVVLLIACANVANLLLVRVEGRQQELATRAALGAGWRRIARELLLESLVLGVAGGVLGLGVAYAALKLLVIIGPETLPRLNEIAIDPAVLAFALAASLISGLLFGVIPILKYSGPRMIGALRSATRTASVSRERHRARNTLVVVQVALALVLLVASGLMIRTFQTLRRVHPGFERPAEVQMLRLSIPESVEADQQRVARSYNEIVEKLAAIPDVKAAAAVSSAPLEGFNSTDPVSAEDKTYTPGQIPPLRRFKFVSPNYFQTVGTPLIAGRDFTWTDIHDDRRVTVVSENMAREMWGSAQAALGKRIRVGNADSWREIVGVAGDVYDNGVHEPAPGIVYWPFMMSQFWGQPRFVSRGLTYLVRSDRTNTDAFLAQVRQAVWSVNSNLPLALVRTLQDVYERSMARTTFTLVMLAIAGGMALLLGLIGIYGVISYSVSQRTREIGIRMALGVNHTDVRRMFVRHGLVLAGIGIGIGIAVAAGLARVMASLLFNVSPLDAVTYLAVSFVLAFAAVLASYLPARRAAALNPVQALRAE
jgi:predicted permease